MVDSVSESEQDQLQVAVERARLDVELAQLQRATSQRALAAAENQLRSAERSIARLRIVAPLDGIVVDIRRQRGEWVKPGDKTIRLIDTSRLRAEGLVPASQLTRDLVGHQVAFIVDSPKESTRNERDPANTHRGKLTFISPEANPVSGHVRVWAEIDNVHGRLRPGETGRLLINTGRIHSSDDQEPADSAVEGTNS